MRLAPLGLSSPIDTLGESLDLPILKLLLATPAPEEDLPPSPVDAPCRP